MPFLLSAITVEFVTRLDMDHSSIPYYYSKSPPAALSHSSKPLVNLCIGAVAPSVYMDSYACNGLVFMFVAIE